MVQRAPVEVYIRLRPLIAQEVKENDQEINLKHDSQESQIEITYPTGGKLKKTQVRGLSNVLDISYSNREVFDQVMGQKLNDVLLGKTLTVFTYGHSGSGKTHTIIGAPKHPGLFSQAAQVLCEAVSATQNLCIQVRFSELHNNKCYDLLNQRAECFLREDESGCVHIRSATIKLDQGKYRVNPLHTENVRTAQDVALVFEKAKELRKVGLSTVHDASSRSHAILELEIVSPELIKAREACIAAESEIVPVKNAIDDLNKELFFMEYMNQDGEWVKRPSNEDDIAIVAQKRSELRQYERERDQWQDQINVSRRTELEILSSRHDHSSNSHSSSIDGSSHSSQSTPRIGGKLILVDLAGADYEDAVNGKLDQKTLKESRAINASLLALKECIRALRKGNNHAPFRNSNLTRVLKEPLTFRDRDATQTIMIATASISEKAAIQTLNTIRYASMVAE